MSIRGIGGANKYPSRSMPLTKAVLRELYTTYEALFSEEKQVYATWDVHYIIVRKT